MTPKQPIVATYFGSLELRNVRCFGDRQRLDLRNDNGELSQWTLILGDNGSGKTTLLQCLVWMRPVIVDDLGGSEGGDVEEPEEPRDPNPPIRIGILGPALTEENNETVEQLLRINGKLDLQISAAIYQGEKLSFNSQPKGKKVETKIRATFDSKKLLKSFDSNRIDIQSDMKERFWEPFIIAYGANRQMGFQNVSNTDLEDPLAARLSEVTELYDAVERLTKLHHAALDQKSKSGEDSKDDKSASVEERLLTTFKQALVEILPDEILSTEAIEIDAPRLVDGVLKESQVKIRSLSRHVPFSYLSLGYQTTLAWTLDLSWRLFNRYPNSINPLEEPAIVLIDEIDLHLHPLWQWQIMRKLANVFKRTQFIATAHSPLMVQSMPNSNFAVVQKSNDAIIIENNPERVRGWRVDQILNSEYFGLPVSRPPETEKLFKERSQLLLKLKRSKAEERRLKQLEQQILALPTAGITEEREAFKLLKQATQLLKSKKA